MDPKPLSGMKKCSTPSLDSPKDGHPIATSDSKIKIEFRTNKKASELAFFLLDFQEASHRDRRTDRPDQNSQSKQTTNHSRN